MSDEQTSALSVTADQVREIVAGESCAACGGSKRRGSAFCPTDFAALTIWQRGMLASEDALFVEAFRGALRHLQLNPQRRLRLPGKAGEWRFASDQELVAAGYRFLNHTDCTVPRCGQRVVWYRTPNEKSISVNLATYQPHRTTCADPEYFSRRRAQTSARRRGGSR